jgi:hypothetical protein
MVVQVPLSRHQKLFLHPVKNTLEVDICGVPGHANQVNYTIHAKEHIIIKYAFKIKQGQNLLHQSTKIIQ